MSIFTSHISGINNIRYIVSSLVYKGGGGWFQEISCNHPRLVPRNLLEPPGGGTNVILIKMLVVWPHYGSYIMTLGLLSQAVMAALGPIP